MVLVTITVTTDSYMGVGLSQISPPKHKHYIVICLGGVSEVMGVGWVSDGR